MPANDQKLRAFENTPADLLFTMASAWNKRLAMKLALKALGLAILGGCFSSLGYAGQDRFGAAMIVGGLMMYVGGAIIFGELRRMYYRHQRERNGS